jgi:hypothetical protein
MVAVRRSLVVGSNTGKFDRADLTSGNKLVDGTVHRGNSQRRNLSLRSTANFRCGQGPLRSFENFAQDKFLPG